MKIAFFKTRCLVCWKLFEAPVLPDSSYGENLFYDKKQKRFFYFNWFDNKEIENCVNDFLFKNNELKSRNYDRKGIKAKKILEFMANDDKECVLSHNRCPRCGLKFNSISNTKTDIREIEEMNFDFFLNLDKNEREKFLLEKAKVE